MEIEVEKLLKDVNSLEDILNKREADKEDNIYYLAWIHYLFDLFKYNPRLKKIEKIADEILANLSYWESSNILEEIKTKIDKIKKLLFNNGLSPIR